MSDKPKLQPLNNLEIVLIRAYEGHGVIDLVTQALLDSSLYILTDRAMAPGVWDPEATPLQVRDDAAGKLLMPAFTHLDHLAGWAEQFPQFPHPQQVAMRWLLKGLAQDVTLVINRGWPASVEIPPGGVAEMKALV